MHDIVYIDESGMNDNDFYPYAYSKIGVRHYSSYPGHYKKRLSMIGGLCANKFLAPFMFEGHCNAAIFTKYLEKVLLPALPPGKTIVMDNASFHKSSAIEQAIADAKCSLIYLPPYSPDLNPIEHYWHRVKTAIRKMLRDTGDTLDKCMGMALKNMCKC